LTTDQPKGQPGLIFMAEEEGKGKGKGNCHDKWAWHFATTTTTTTTRGLFWCLKFAFFLKCASFK